MKSSNPVGWLALSTRWVLAVVAVVSTGMIALPAQLRKDLTSEGHVVEMASLVFIGTGVILAALELKRRRTVVWISAVTLLMWAFLRELDFQKRFTYRSVESLGFFTGTRATIEEKLVVLLVLFPFAAAGIHLLLLLKKSLKTGLRQRETWSSHLIGVVVLGVFALVGEKLVRGAGQAVEEVCEVGVAASVLLMVQACRLRPD